MTKRSGDTLLFANAPEIGAWAAVGGKKEGEGPLAAGFDALYEDNALGEASWEKAESDLLTDCAQRCLARAGVRAQEVNLAFAGDLQAQ